MTEVERLLEENETLRVVIQDLRTAVTALNEAVGRVTFPAIPNN